MIVKCQYCGERAKLVTGCEIYPERLNLSDLKFWRCDPCDAHVGVHKGTNTPLGELANKQLRRYRSMAHRYFDPIWRSGTMNRKEAYNWLSQRMGIEYKDCHIAWFDLDQCKRVVTIVKYSGLLKEKPNDKQNYRGSRRGILGNS